MEVTSVYRPTPPQVAYRRSTALIRGYGGAMGGGKSRALCEQAFDYALDHPGILIPVFRQEHTSIVRTTRKTFYEQVIPPELLAACDTKNSQGEDWIRFPNGSEIHFVGLSDPIRWFSSELGAVFFDEAQEMPESYVTRIITRLRQRCRPCIESGAKECEHLPHNASFAFNPDNPGHFLQRWFILGTQETEHGRRKEQLFPQDENGEVSDESLGDCEFIFARATDNPYLSERYMRILRGLPPADRKRYLEGIWDFSSGRSFFDKGALERYQAEAMETRPVLVGRTEGDVEADALWRTRKLNRPKDPVRLVSGKGPLSVFAAPVKRAQRDDGTWADGHRYVMGIDVSSGEAADYAGIQIIDVEDWKLAARFQDRVSPSELATQAYRLGRVYNNALAVPEITGGWGFAVEQDLKRFRYPNLYTRRVLDRLTKKWTDKTGWDTTVKMRAHMLSTLGRVLEEGDFAMGDLATVQELATFVRGANGKPEAQPGCHDDLVMALAIAVTVAADMPRQLVRLKNDDYRPAVSAVVGY